MYVVTGATGKLGSLVVQGLLERLPAAAIALLARNIDPVRSFADRGVHIHLGDYATPTTLAHAFGPGDRVLFISSSAVRERQIQHENVVRAAKTAGVEYLAYTSTLHAGTSKMDLAVEHLETEQMVAASGIAHTFLRNGWYLENYTEYLDFALERGVMLGAAKDGNVAAASRADFAAAAVEALIDTRLEGQTLELAGDEAFTMTELAAEVSRHAGRVVLYKNMPAEDYQKTLLGFGMAPRIAALLADTDQAIARGEMDEPGRTLSRVIGRRTTRMADAVEKAVGHRRS